MKRKAEEEEGEAKRVKIESGHAAAATPEAANPEDVTAAARGPANVQSSAMAENEAEEQMKVEPMEESPGQQTIRVIPPTPSVTAAPVSSSPAAQAIQVIPPTPSSEVRLVEIHKESEVRVVDDDEAMSDGLRADEEDRVESKEGTEEREFEPDLEVELDPEPEPEEVA